MIPIDVRKLSLPRDVDVSRCKDESVRLVRYNKPVPPDDLLTMQKRSIYYGDGTEYMLSVHLPQQRVVEILATVAHTSANCWKVTVSTNVYSDSLTYKTLNEVTDKLQSVFK